MTKKLVLILGPHRTGTSTVTAAVAALGADTGLKENPASIENAKGFFEHESIILLNEEILQHLGGSWDNPSFRYDEAPKDVPEITTLQAKAVALIQALFPSPSFIVLKEPRFCHLLPFWLEVFSQCGWQKQNIFCIHTLRHPVEAALSQQKRVFNRPDFYELGRKLEEGLALWLSLTTQALKDSAHLHNLFVPYAELVQQPEQTLRRMAAFLQVEPAPQAIAHFIDDFIDADLYRNTVTPVALAHARLYLPESLRLFDKLSAFTTRTMSARKQKALAQKFSRASVLRRIDSWTIIATSRLSYLARCRGGFLKEYQNAPLHTEPQD